MPSQFDSLKSVLSLKHFPLNRSRYCTVLIYFQLSGVREKHTHIKQLCLELMLYTEDGMQLSAIKC